MNKLFAVSLTAIMLSAPAVSNAELSFNLGAVSLYKDRGVDQDGRNQDVRPAIQGGIDYGFDNGLYAGTWMSSGRFGDANAEIDVYGGFQGNFTEDFGYDIGYIHYYYPKEGSWNSGEVYIGLNYQRLGLKVYRGMRKNVNKDDMYYQLTYTHPLMEKLNATVGVGYQYFAEPGVRSKVDYSLGLDYAIRENISVYGLVAGANRKKDVDDGSRDTRVIVGLNFTF